MLQDAQLYLPPPPRLSGEPWDVEASRLSTIVAAGGMFASSLRSEGPNADGHTALLEARPIYVDSNMIRAGLSQARLRSVSPDYSAEKIVCHVADEDVAQEAQHTHLPRSLFAARKAREVLNGGLAVFGNAPVGLLELNRLIIEEHIRPALVVGMPVGFVHVVESKRELMSLSVPFIVLEGRRGNGTCPRA